MFCHVLPIDFLAESRLYLKGKREAVKFNHAVQTTKEARDERNDLTVNVFFAHVTQKVLKYEENTILNKNATNKEQLMRYKQLLTRIKIIIVF